MLGQEGLQHHRVALGGRRARRRRGSAPAPGPARWPRHRTARPGPRAPSSGRALGQPDRQVGRDRGLADPTLGRHHADHATARADGLGPVWSARAVLRGPAAGGLGGAAPPPPRTPPASLGGQDVLHPGPHRGQAQLGWPVADQQHADARILSPSSPASASLARLRADSP